jgi:hypothetical protein
MLIHTDDKAFVMALIDEALETSNAEIRLREVDGFIIGKITDDITWVTEDGNA